MALWNGKPEWGKAWMVFKDSWTMLVLPNVIWALLINGITLGANIAIGMTVSLHIRGYEFHNRLTYFLLVRRNSRS